MLHPIDSLADPRLDVYRHLKDTNATRWRHRFIAEGEKLVERLLDSALQVESLLVGQRHAERFARQAPDDVPIFVVPDEWIERIIGFNFHRGILAAAHRPARRRLAELTLPQRKSLRVVVCPDVQDPENLGSILRISAAFGVDAVLLGPHCADPYSRRVLRVSMGAVFQLPVVQSDELAQELDLLRAAWRCQLWATVLDDSAVKLSDLAPLPDVPQPGDCQIASHFLTPGTIDAIPDRLALLLGSEGHGLSDNWIALCDRRVMIPMHPGTDSLNVAVAAGIFLYEVTRSTAARNNSSPA